MKTGQYIRRAVGYFIKLIVLVIVLYLLLFVTGTARVSAGYFVGELFATPRGLMLLGALAVLAACYPMFGYVSRRMAADLREDRVPGGRVDDLPGWRAVPPHLAHVR